MGCVLVTTKLVENWWKSAGGLAVSWSCTKNARDEVRFGRVLVKKNPRGKKKVRVLLVYSFEQYLNQRLSCSD